MHLGAVLICQRLHIIVPVGLKIVDIVTQSCQSCSIVPFGPLVGLRVIRVRAEQLGTQARPLARNEFPPELCSIVGQDM